MAEPPKPPPKRALDRQETRPGDDGPPGAVVEHVQAPPRPDPRREGSLQMPTVPRPAVGNVPVPAGSFGNAPPPAPPPSPKQPELSLSSHDFLLRSMAPPSPTDDDPEETRVGATVVGAPAYRPKQQSPARRAYLTVIAGNRAGEMFKLEGEEIILGRGPQSGVHLDSDGVSRKHARVVRQGDDFLIEDLKSTNGTWVEDRRITFHKLKDGDRVQVGTEVIVRFNYHDEMEAQLQQQLYESAVRDPLTRAYNRKHFAERLRAELAHAIRHKTHLSLIMFDIDYFKKVNDTYGHPGGDQVLRAIANAIQRVIRVEDVFARVGGEEFALLARGIDGTNGYLFAERLRRGIERLEIPWNTGAIPVTASFGVSTYTELKDPTDGDRLVAEADRRLYEAKTGGRNRVVGPP
jgi:two-component system, cell cycle response regulator